MFVRRTIYIDYRLLRMIQRYQGESLIDGEEVSFSKAAADLIALGIAADEFVSSVAEEAERTLTGASLTEELYGRAFRYIPKSDPERETQPVYRGLDRTNRDQGGGPDAVTGSSTSSSIAALSTHRRPADDSEPVGISATLQQILGVLGLIWETEQLDHNKTVSIAELRTRAVRTHAEAINVREQTVADKFIRRLSPYAEGVDTFDRLVHSWLRHGTDDLAQVLMRRFKDLHERQAIAKFFDDHPV